MTLSHRRLLLLFACLAAWALICVVRLAQVQLLDHQAYVVRAQRQQERTVSLEPVRGAILDARGRVLAESVAAVSVYADPQAIGDPRPVGRALSRIPSIGLSARELTERLKSDGGFFWIARQLPLAAGDQIRMLRIPGI